MSGTSDLIAQGFGSWSTVAKVPTLGLGSAAVTPPADGGMEWLIPDTRLEWTIEDTRLEWTISNTRLEWLSK
tara:strand:+ start:416 stop:631 length:216 start_codon:yes stop_codon:yes gene_type:complete